MGGRYIYVGLNALIIKHDDYNVDNSEVRMDIPVSVCYITKDESELLQKSLKSMKSFGFELVVVDTGSSDDTMSMVREYTDSLYEFEWIDDFAAAKNYSISKAKNDMVLVVDSDEYFLEGDMNRFFQKVQSYGVDVGSIDRREYTPDENGALQESVTSTPRFFDRRLYHYAGRIHEQVVRGSVFDLDRDDTRERIEKQKADELRVYDTGLLFAHTGYAGAEQVRKMKASRNVSLLKKELNKYPDSAQLLYQMAKSMYVAEGVKASIEYYEKALGCDLNPEIYWVRDLINCYGYALLEMREYEKALSLEAVYDDLKEYADYLFLMGLIHLNNAMFELASEEFIRCTELKADSSVGTNSFKAYYNAGVIEESMGHIHKAISFYAKAGEYIPAKQGLNRCLNSEKKYD